MRRYVAITGGIGSGKSSVLQIVKSLGYPAFSCDEINRELLLDKAYIFEFSKLFPMCMQEGRINVNTLRERVFSNKSELNKLNNLAHPFIMRKLFDKMETFKEGLVFAEVPLLFENHYEELFNEVIVVLRNLETRISSVQFRDGVKREDILQRIQMQFDYKDILKYSKNKNLFLIHNDKDILTLKNDVEKILKRLSL